MAQSAAKLEVSEQQREELLRVVKASSSSQRDVRRARIVLLRAEGKSQEETAREVGVNRPVVGLWERRFRSEGLAGLKDAKGRGRKASIAPQTVERVVTEAVQPHIGEEPLRVAVFGCEQQGALEQIGTGLRWAGSVRGDPLIAGLDRWTVVEEPPVGLEKSRRARGPQQSGSAPASRRPRRGGCRRARRRGLRGARSRSAGGARVRAGCRRRRGGPGPRRDRGPPAGSRLECSDRAPTPRR